jgi:alpha-N-arabinofuranosidase
MTQQATLRIHDDRPELPVSKYMFGHFVEDMKDHMEGMLAFATVDMDFEEEDLHYRGVSSPWYPVTDGSQTVYRLAPAAPGHSGHSQSFKIYADEPCFAGIAQKASVEPGMIYDAKMYMRASVEIGFVDISLHSLRDGAMIDSARIPMQSHDWREYSCRLRWSGEDRVCELRVTTNTREQSWTDYLTNGMVWIDHVSLLPVDHVGFVRKSVLEMSKALQCRLMRLGGNQISAYHWKDYVGPHYNRPYVKSEAWDHWGHKYFGTDEFVRFCREVGSEPLICLNAGSGTPEEALQWIEYCNGSKETPMGAWRAANGHEEPYGIKYWEIGNELWGAPQVGHCNAEQYAERCLQFARAIREDYPDLKLMACGHRDPEWNRAVLERAGEYIDMLTIHYYHGMLYPAQLMKPGSVDEYKYVAVALEAFEGLIDRARQALLSDARYRHIQLALTEYNVVYPQVPNYKRGPDQHTIEAAVGIAGMLHSFLKNADIVFASNFSDLVNGWNGGCIRVSGCGKAPLRGLPAAIEREETVIYGTPAYYVMQMYAGMQPLSVVSSEMECGTFELPEAFAHFRVPVGPVYDTLSFPLVDAVVCKDGAGRYVAFAINRALEEIDLTIQLSGNPKLTEVRYVGGLPPKSINSPAEPENMTCLTGHANIASQTVAVKLKANSVYAIRITC